MISQNNVGRKRIRGRASALLQAICLCAAIALCALTAASAAEPLQDKPVINSFSSTPEMILPGTNVTLSWNVSGASNLTISPGAISVTSTVELSAAHEQNGSASVAAVERPMNMTGSINVSPSVSTIYTLTAANQAGESTANATVIVQSPKMAKSPVISYFVADPPLVQEGRLSTLKWSVAEATEASISGYGSIALTGTMSVMPDRTTTYVLSAKNREAVASARATVEVQPVRPARPMIYAFEASPQRIRPGEAVTLSWRTTGATEVFLGDIGLVPPIGSKRIYPSQTTVYTLKASNSVGGALASLKVTVSSPPVINHFRADQYRIFAGQLATLSWSVTGASSVSIYPSVGSAGPSGSVSVNPEKSTTYTLIAENSAGRVADSVRIIVTQTDSPILFGPEPSLPVEPVMPEPEPGPIITPY